VAAWTAGGAFAVGVVAGAAARARARNCVRRGFRIEPRRQLTRARVVPPVGLSRSVSTLPTPAAVGRWVRSSILTAGLGIGGVSWESGSSVGSGPSIGSQTMSSPGVSGTTCGHSLGLTGGSG
jgi:hypothetical protein